MHIKKLMILTVYISLLSAYSAIAATKETTDNNPSPNNSGFTFSPIAHAHTAELLDFIANYSRLNIEEQKSVYLEVVQNLAEDKSDIKFRIKHAAILAIPNSDLRDTATAQQHLEVLLEDHTLSESNTNLLRLLYTFTLDHNTESQKLRDTTKKAGALKQRNKALSQKLNDLKNIEKTMIERNAKSSKP